MVFHLNSDIKERYQLGGAFFVSIIFGYCADTLHNKAIRKLGIQKT